MSRVLDKYLALYADPIARQIPPLQKSWNCKQAVVVPAYNECFDDIWRIWQSLSNTNSLLILVVNQAESNSRDTKNAACAQALASRLTLSWSCESGQLKLYDGQLGKLLIVDCYTTSRRLPADQGVGLARKIGADIACALYKQEALSQAWIFSTDADVSLPANYVACTTGISKNAAMILLPFSHQPCDIPDLNLAQAFYDFHLQYYVDALCWASSPYAYHTMGSAQIINMEHYAAVRGYPKRSAGEDFYLLNKLAKTGEIIELDQPSVLIQTRQSERTPFGTGAAISDIMSLTEPVTDYLFYHPRIFAELRDVIASLENSWQQDTIQKLSSPAVDVLGALQFDIAFEKARENSRTKSALVRHLHNWFDAFRTLKFVHLMRERHYPSINLMELSITLPAELESARSQAENLLQRAQ